MAQAGLAYSTPCPVRPLALEAARIRRFQERLGMDAQHEYDLLQTRFDRLEATALSLRAQSPEGLLYQTLAVYGLIGNFATLHDADGEDAGGDLAEINAALVNMVGALRTFETQALVDYYLLAPFVAEEMVA